MLVRVFVAVMSVVCANAGACQFQVALNEQQRENYIADTARQPDGDK